MAVEMCEICDNLLYIRSENDVTLVKYCKHCSFSKKDEWQTAIKISQTLYSDDELLYLQYNNIYLRNDHTLPRVKDMTLKCPNNDCTGNRDDPRTIYVEYNRKQKKYLYCCDYCGTTWRKENDSK